ncbi:hypothetical protein [Pedobacter sp. UBA5917]|uniref:hypothetical protein n=1 Tax=Pedobacter sp. UBA5917 TaxID=1947061 RepID=UPI0025E9B3B9|nr:hypothetical protein [Pedobacter sp. UBA5917]
MKKFLIITSVMLIGLSTYTFAGNTPCCNRKMNNCNKCSVSCTKGVCEDYCSKQCKDTGGCKKCK